MSIAPPTEPGPAPSPGGRTRAAPRLSADTLDIPPYDGLAYWKTRTAPERGHNLRAMMEQYAQTVGPDAQAEPPAHGTSSIAATVVLENGNYYQVSITPGPLEHRWELEAVDLMPPMDMDLPDDPIPLLSD